MAYTFVKAQGGNVGISLVDDSKLDYCNDMLKKAEELGKKILLPKMCIRDRYIKGHIQARIFI